IAVKALKLRAQRRCRRRSRVLQQCQMKPLQATVLLRLARLDTLRQHAGLDHLHRQLRQSASAGRGERRSVVRAQPKRQAKLAERGIENRPRVLTIIARQRLTPQQITAVGIVQRHWLATLAVACNEPAFEVNAPYVVGRRALSKRHARRRTAAPYNTLD